MYEIEQKKKYFLIVGIVALILCIVGIIVWQKLVRGKDDPAAGVAQLQKLEAKDVAAIEDQIEELEQEEQKAEELERSKDAQKAEKTERSQDKNDVRPVKERFAGALVMGDSITQGLTEYRILNSENVVAKIGVQLTKLDYALEKAVSLNHKKIFLSYGMNDIEATRGNTDVFQKQYQEIIDYLKTHIPEAEIYVNSILPVKEKYIRKYPYYAQLDRYNEALQELCEEEEVTYIDNTTLVKEEYYEPDGVHMIPKYYDVWLAHMAEVGKL